MTKVFQIEPHVRSMIDDDGAVLLDLKAGKYYSLNGVAASIWTRVEQNLNESEIVGQLSELYSVEPAQIEGDLAELAADLKKKGLIRGRS